MELKRIFNKSKNVVIGAIHFPPLFGYKDSPGLKVALKNALADLRAFEKGGVDALIFENNYDLPHKMLVDSPVVASMTYLGQELKKATKLPVGVSVLWNDYKTALSIAKVLGLQFIRIPAFVDTVETSYGIAKANYKEAIAFRKLIGAKDVGIFADIHVKHAKLLSKHTLLQSAKLAIKAGADGLILTGKWTGDVPDLKQLKSLRKGMGSFPILIGSGTNAENIKSLLSLANATIVSTSVKQGSAKVKETNVKPYSRRVSEVKVRTLLRALR